MKFNSLRYFILGLGLIGTAVSTNAQVQLNSNKKIQNQQNVNSVELNPNIQSSTSQEGSSGHSPTVEINGERCATDILMDAYLEKNGIKAQYKAQYQEMINNLDYSGSSRATYTIPVVFHVVYNTSAENVSTSAIMDMFNELNDDYQLQNPDRTNARTSQYGFTPADVDVNFCLAVRDPQNNPLSQPGIHRVQTSKTYFDPNTESNDMKYTSSGGTESWDNQQYLNVWICNITNGASSGVAGYSYSPTTSYLPPADIDGIVIDYQLAFPPSEHVLTHEVGHYLGLPHTWGNSNQGTSCSDDDGFTDTPNTKGPSFDYPGSCSGNQVTCTDQTQYENFMDYCNCTCMFTQGQVSLMQGILATSRSSLQGSMACTPLNPSPPNTDFTADITTVVSGGTVNFTDLSTNYPTSWSWEITPTSGWSYIGGTSSTDQDPKVQFNTTGTYTVKLTTSNTSGSDSETKTNYITVIASGGGPTVCDTLRNWLTSESPNTYRFSAPSWGYLQGTASFENPPGFINITDYAEPLNASTSSEVRAIRIAIAKVENVSGNASVEINVYDDNGGTPGTVLTSENVLYDDIDEGFWNTFELSTPVTVSGQFWVGYSLQYSNPQDTLVAFTAEDRGANGTTYMYLDNNGWYDVVTATGLYSSIFMDALLSNGPVPNASLSITDNETCQNSPVSMNGYGSTNTNNYLWYFDNGTDVYYSTDGDLNYDFDEGTWDIELHAQGSCFEDIATTTLTVNPALQPNSTVTPENCNDGSGSITVSPTGGNGGPYNVSINNGATFTNNSPYDFNSLSAGSYTTIINDGTGCSDTISLIVDDINSFNPTVSPSTSVSINAGDNVTLTANGGTSWTWYEGTIVIGTSQSITVSPTTTTIYNVNIMDANGCSKDKEVTVTVGTSGIQESELSNMINIYPNPSKGVFNLSISPDYKQDLNVKVYDLIGNLIQEINYTDSDKSDHAVDLSGKESGTYVIRISGHFGSTTKRVVLTK